MALVDTKNPGAGILVDTRGIGRPVGDTSSGSVFLTNLPKNFHGGDEGLHWALGELFGKYGKIKKIELYTKEGQMGVEDFTGEALIVYHPSKKTGSHDAGDAVYDACTDCDGKMKLLGDKHWRIAAEAAEWQKSGYSVKDKQKTSPAVEIKNLWEYDPSLPISHWIQMQEGIREEAAKHVESPFVKVEPSEGMAIIWCKGAQDTMKLAGIMHKSFFQGRKIVAELCRKVKPKVEQLPKLPTGPLSMEEPEPAPAEVGPAPAPMVDVEKSFEKDIEEALPQSTKFRLRQGTRVRIVGLVAKPENNGKTGDLLRFLPDLQKYSIKLDFDKTVRVSRENLEVLDEMTTAQASMSANHLEMKISDLEAQAAEEGEAASAAAKWAAKLQAKPQAIADVDAIFQPTVCVDPSLLPKRETEEEKEAQSKRRESSRSRERRLKEREAAIRARVEAARKEGDRPKWVMPSPQEMSAQAGGAGGAAGATGAAPAKEPPESREELLKMSVGKLKELLKEYGKTPRGCLEKRDFVDRLKPAPKA